MALLPNNPKYVLKIHMEKNMHSSQVYKEFYIYSSEWKLYLNPILCIMNGHSHIVHNIQKIEPANSSTSQWIPSKIFIQWHITGHKRNGMLLCIIA